MKIDNAASSCAELIEKSKNISVLTGAGISTAAGIPDFRGPKGLYVTRQYDPETVFDIDYFMIDPKPFYDFARDFVGMEEKIKPTAAHYFFAELEKRSKIKAVITQNIDALHHRAGSKNVLELHGSFWQSFCMRCRQEYSYEVMKEKIFQADIPHCSCGGVIKPDVVFFGENVKRLDEAFSLAAAADLFFVVGTSCVVYPAAMVPNYTNGKIVIVNKGEVSLSGNVVLKVQDDIDDFFNRVSKILD